MILNDTARCKRGSSRTSGGLAAVTGHSCFAPSWQTSPCDKDVNVEKKPLLITSSGSHMTRTPSARVPAGPHSRVFLRRYHSYGCLLYTSDAADERSSV